VSRLGNMKTWLQRAGATQVRETGVGNLISTCPFHRDSHPSFSMNTENGLFLCYAQGCGVSGNLINFLMTALGWNFLKAQEAMNEMDIPSLDDPSVYTLPPYERRRCKDLEVETSKIREGHLGMYRFCPQYMVERGYSKAMLREWEIGYDFGIGRVTIPVRDRSRKLLGITKRSTYDDRPPKYLHLGFKKGSHLYGAYKDPEAREVVAVEGQVDVLAWYALQKLYNFEPILCVSTMGSRVSQVQIEMLSRYKRVYMAFDNDTDGIATTSRVGEGLMRRMNPGNVLVLRGFPDSCKDVGDVYEKQVKARKAKAFRYEAETFDRVRLDSLKI
jgi:DNA primase